MNKVFSIAAPFQAPDGTWVSPFLNAKDSQSDLPFDLLDGFSIAAGMIDPVSCSKIHVMPFVTQVTFVRSGNLAVIMKRPSDAGVHTLRLAAGQSVLTEPGEFFQLINEDRERCEVLYIVSPAYVFDMDLDGSVLYDDSLVLEEDWAHLAMAEWRAAKAMPTREQREGAIRSLLERKRKRPNP